MDELQWSDVKPCETAWDETRNLPGVYKWYLTGELPNQFEWPAHLTPIRSGDLVYVGKGTNLRTRAKHHKLKTPGSTLRRSFAGLMGMQAQWFGRSANHGLVAADEIVLSNWMANNLSMSFAILGPDQNLSDVENGLLLELKAPLNRDGHTKEQRHTSAMAKALKDNAIGQKGLM